MPIASLSSHNDSHIDFYIRSTSPIDDYIAFGINDIGQSQAMAYADMIGKSTVLYNVIIIMIEEEVGLERIIYLFSL